MKYLLISIAFIMITSCTRQQQSGMDIKADGTESTAIINDQHYSNIPVNNFRISSCVVKGDQLEITITSGGCSGNDWQVALVGNSMIAESYPPQRYAKISFTNTEDCFAYISKKYSFDITPFRVSGMNTVIINLQGWNKQLVYAY
ncbi:MAG: hypothetical protein ACK5NK_16775 [Niabella sp.]